jgi:hypothetical protein
MPPIVKVGTDSIGLKITDQGKVADFGSFGFVRHQIIKDDGTFQGTLVPASKSLANAAGYEIFDQYVYDPVDLSIYEAPEQDIGFDDTARVWASILASLGPGVASGVADPDYQIDYRLASGSYAGFQPWSIGNVTARFIRQRIVITTSAGLLKITGFLPTLDAKERTEGGTSVTIGVGGTAITFATTFHNKPRVKVTVDAASALIGTKKNVSTTGFTAQVFNTSGVDVGGTIDWEATGI